MKLLRPVAVALGSNLGDRQAWLEQAAARVAEDVLVGARASSVYETEPWGIVDQPKFLNAVVVGESDWDPVAIVRYAKNLEAELGRRERQKNGPREIDVDLLYWGDRTWEAPGVSVPHPRMDTRGFVLAPLAEVSPDWVHPRYRVTVRELWARLPESERRASTKVASLPLNTENP